MHSWTNVEHVKRCCNWHQTFVLLSIAKRSMPNWHSTGVHEDWAVANVSLLRQIYEWAAGVGDYAVIAVFVLAWDFFFLVLRLVFLRPCGRWSGLRQFLWPFVALLLISFLFLLMKLTKFLFYLLSCFFFWTDIQCRKLCDRSPRSLR